MACHAPGLVQTRFKDVCDALEHNQMYFHSNVKFHVCLAYLQMTVGLMRLEGKLDEDDKFHWVKGKAEDCPLPSMVTKFLQQIVFPYIFKVLEVEDDKEVIERVFENLRELGEELGPAAYTGVIEEVMKHIVIFLQKKAYCQTLAMADEDDEDLEDVVEGDGPDDEEDEESEEGDDGIDHDEIIFGNVTDLVLELARCYGNEFEQAWNVLAPLIVEYTSDKHPKHDKNMALGCIAEVFAAAECVIPKYFNDYLPLLEKNSHYKDSKVNRNVAYSIGVLAQHAPLLFQPHVTDCLALLARLHAESTEIDAQDNIVAASCRIVEYQFMPIPAA